MLGGEAADLGAGRCLDEPREQTTRLDLPNGYPRARVRIDLLPTIRRANRCSVAELQLLNLGITSLPNSLIDSQTCSSSSIQEASRGSITS